MIDSVNKTVNKAILTDEKPKFSFQAKQYYNQLLTMPNIAPKIAFEPTKKDDEDHPIARFVPEKFAHTNSFAFST